MAAEGAEERVLLVQEEANEENIESAAVSSDSEDSDDDAVEAPPQVEWLATTREKRSTAGNRMKSMLAAEEPDDELELLFAEDGDDAGFSDVDDGDSDVQMDSSSDDEDAQAQDAEDEGEQELQKQIRERKQAARKRKAQDAIPAKFRKKVRTDPTATSSSATTPAPRPKKKSERASWLPSVADLPTRASKRETTMLSKEALHQQMVEREAKRLKLMEAMERKAKRMEALKKPPMTQAERLAEAAVIEKRNAKSLNRWEEAEKQREEERRAKLAALNNRQLSGPVLTFWSGMGEWVDGKLKHLGKTVVVEEKPLPKKRVSTVGLGKANETAEKEDAAKSQQPKDLNPYADPVTSVTPTTAIINGGGASDNSKDSTAEMQKESQATAAVNGDGASDNSKIPTADIQKEPQATTAVNTSTSPSSAQTETAAASAPVELPNSTSPSLIQTKEEPSLTAPISQTIAPELKVPESSPATSKPPIPIPSEPKAPEMAVLNLQSSSASPYTTSVFAPPAQPHGPVMKPPEMKPLSNSFLAPPPGATKSGLSMPMLGYSSPAGQTSNGLAAPNATQRQSPLSMPQADTRPPPPPPTPASMARPASTEPPQIDTPVPITAPKPKHQQAPGQLSSKPLSTSKPSHTNTSRKAKEQPSVPDLPPSPRPPLPPNMKATCNSIVLQNFDENAIEQKSVQQRILFGKEMGKLAKPAPAPKCIITNKPARYKDPSTGLPYYDSRAYKELQKLQRGEYKWSSLVGAWVGTGSFAAQGVPARFLDPNAPAPPKPPVVKQEPIAVSTQASPLDKTQSIPKSTPTTKPATPAGTAPVVAKPPAQVGAIPPPPQDGAKQTTIPSATTIAIPIANQTASADVSMTDVSTPNALLPPVTPKVETASAGSALLPQ